MLISYVKKYFNRKSVEVQPWNPLEVMLNEFCLWITVRCIQRSSKWVLPHWILLYLPPLASTQCCNRDSRGYDHVPCSISFIIENQRCVKSAVMNLAYRECYLLFYIEISEVVLIKLSWPEKELKIQKKGIDKERKWPKKIITSRAGFQKNL